MRRQTSSNRALSSPSRRLQLSLSGTFRDQNPEKRSKRALRLQHGIAAA